MDIETAPSTTAQDTTETAPATTEATTTTEAAPAKPAEPKRHPSIAALAKADREYRLKTKEAEAIASKYKPIEEAIASKNIGALLEHAGLSLEDVVNSLADQHRQRTPEELIAETAQAEFKKLQDAEAEKAAKVNEAKAAETTQRIKEHIGALAKKDPEKYELVNALDLHDEAFLLIEKVFVDSNGATFIPPEKALEMVEEGKRKELSETKFFQSAAHGTGAKAGAPTAANRNTSGVPAVGDDADAGPLDNRAILRRALKAAHAAG